MFGHQFYPTPEKIALKVFHQFSLKPGHRILDPSAGDGALLTPFALRNERSLYSKPYGIYAIELDPELRVILRSKAEVIGSDFLDYNEPVRFDAIAMNPPFDAGAKHVLHAWEFLASEGRLVALLNAETLRNLYSFERDRLNQLVSQHGKAEELGACFTDSRNPTAVEVVMITLNKPKTEKTFDFAGGKFEKDYASAEAFAANPLAHKSKIQNLVAQYKAAEAILVKRYESQSELNFYLKGIDNPHYAARTNGVDSDRLELKGSLADQLATLKSRFWSTVFNQTQMGKRTTSGFRKEFDEFVKDQTRMAFTVPNILEVLHQFFGNREEIMKKCLLEVFDKATSYHEKNKIHCEGWKTNKAYRVNHTIIDPYGVEYFYGYKVSYRHSDFYRDLDNVLCWLTGTDSAAPSFVSIEKALKANLAEEMRGRWFESDFFDIKFFKKGTVHLRFRSQYTLDDFNQMAADGKKWLGGGY